MKFDITCIIPSSQTDGRLAAFSENVAPQSGPPLHAHKNQTEIFHIISGHFRFHINGEDSELTDGDTIVIPAGTVHTFKNIADTTGILHFELLDAGTSEEFFHRLVHEFETITDIPAFFAAYDLELLGPPLP